MKKNSRIEIKNRKKRGEWAELVFAARALGEGLGLGKPWGESNAYDFVVDPHGGPIVRVQVKSTISKDGAGYYCNLKDCRGPYKRNAFDFVAAYVIPENVWFIIPGKKVWLQWGISLYPNVKNSKYAPNQEAWHLLRGETPGVLARIEACAEEEPLGG